MHILIHRTVNLLICFAYLGGKRRDCTLNIPLSFCRLEVPQNKDAKLKESWPELKKHKLTYDVSDVIIRRVAWRDQLTGLLAKMDNHKH